MFVCSECGWAQPTDGRCNDGTALAPIGDDLLLGTTIGVYRVARLLGIGGMGRVYKGVHPQIGSRVAIKVLSRECSDRKDLVERFFAEARAVNLIRHESIVNVLDLSVLPDGRPFIIMEYLDGQPLSAIIETAQQAGVGLPIGGIARIAVEVLDALGAAHAKGIIHRDLKPDNVFVTPGGRSKVLDFGIAKLQPELGGSATKSGSLLGTPHYMSPEQATGRPIDHRADLYAMGVILFECLTLHKPFQAESLFELLRLHIEAPAPSASRVRGDVSPQLDSVIQTALGKTAEERFSSAAAMSAALQNSTSGLPPEQWAPVVPRANASAATPANWAGTPPSWAGLRAEVEQRSQRPPVSNRGPDAIAATVASGKRPTVAAEAAPSGKSHRGWFVLAGLAIVVGGGVAIATIVTGGASDAKTAEAKVVDVAKDKDKDADVVVDKKKPKKGEKPKKAEKAEDDKDEYDRMEESIDRTVDRTMQKIDEQVDRAFEKAAKRDPAPVQANGAPSKPVTASGSGATTVPPPKAADGWIVRHELRGPAGFDPKHVDVAAFVKFALEEAQREMPEAKLIRVDVDNVDPSGFADLTLASFAASSGTVDVRFVVPSRVPPDPSGHKPFGFEWKCEFRIEAGADQIEVRGMEGFPCTESAVRAPRCSPAAVWKRVKTQIPAAKQHGDLLYRLAPNGTPRWDFSVKGIAEEYFSDDC